MNFVLSSTPDGIRGREEEEEEVGDAAWEHIRIRGHQLKKFENLCIKVDHTNIALDSKDGDNNTIGIYEHSTGEIYAWNNLRATPIGDRRYSYGTDTSGVVVGTWWQMGGENTILPWKIVRHVCLDDRKTRCTHGH